MACLLQTLSRGLRGTCCPSGGGEAWNETTPQQVTVQHDSLSKCADNNGRVCPLSLSLPLIRLQILIRKGCSVSIRYMCRYIQEYVSLVESVTQLLCDCYTDLTHAANVTVFSAPVGVGEPDADFINWHTAAANQVNSCLKSVFGMSNQNIVPSQSGLSEVCGAQGQEHTKEIHLVDKIFHFKSSLIVSCQATTTRAASLSFGCETRAAKIS